MNRRLAFLPGSVTGFPAYCFTESVLDVAERRDLGCLTSHSTKCEIVLAVGVSVDSHDLTPVVVQVEVVMQGALRYNMQLRPSGMRHAHAFDTHYPVNQLTRESRDLARGNSKRMWANHPRMAERWTKHTSTPFSKLPKKVDQKVDQKAD